MVKCSECGFLAVRRKDTIELEEVEFESRQSGDMRPRYHYVPICFTLVANFGEEVEKLEKSPEYATRCDEHGDAIWPQWYDLVGGALVKERECPSFTRWHQGFTPKEHQEMLDRQWLLDFQAKREQEDRDWREHERIEDLEWREKQEQKAEGRHRTDLIIIGIVATLLICAVTIIAAFIERGSLFP